MRETRFNLWVRKIPWRRKWQPTPVLLPGKPHGRRSLGGCSSWCTGTCEMDASPSSPSLGNIPGKLLCSTPRSVRGQGEIQQRSWWYGIRNKSGIPSGLPLVHLHPTSVVEPDGTTPAPASVRDRLSLTREGKLQWKVCLYPHLEQRRTLPVERSHGCGCRIFLSYRWELAVPELLL